MSIAYIIKLPLDWVVKIIHLGRGGAVLSVWIPISFNPQYGGFASSAAFLIQNNSSSILPDETISTPSKVQVVHHPSAIEFRWMEKYIKSGAIRCPVVIDDEILLMLVGMDSLVK